MTRTYLAAENANTGALLNWKPTLNGRAYALGASPNHKTLYVGGLVHQGRRRRRAPIWPSFDVASGKLTSTIPAMGINGTVRAISRAGSSIYIGGSFTQVSVAAATCAWPSSTTSAVASRWARGTPPPTTTCAT